MKFSFVIPAYNNYKLLHQLLFDIYKRCSIPHEIIITDNGNDTETLEGIRWWESVGLLPIRYYRQHRNVGFLLNSNWGLGMSTGNVVSLISTDVRIYGDLVSHWVADGELVGGKVLDWNTGWNQFGDTLFPYVEGWLLTATKQTWEKLNYFDIRYAPNDFEDVDLSTTARSLGMQLSQYPDGFVSHIGAQSIPYGSERESLTKTNQNKFEEKWLT